MLVRVFRGSLVPSLAKNDPRASHEHELTVMKNIDAKQSLTPKYEYHHTFYS